MPGRRLKDWLSHMLQVAIADERLAVGKTLKAYHADPAPRPRWSRARVSPGLKP